MSVDPVNPYLWDRSGEPDRELDELEANLRIFGPGAEPIAPALPLAARADTRARRPWTSPAAAAALTLGVGLTAAWWSGSQVEGPAVGLVAPAVAVTGPDNAAAATESVSAAVPSPPGPASDPKTPGAAAGVDPAKRPRRSKELAREVVERVAKERTHEVQRCYQAGLRRDPQLQGRVEVQFVVGPRGKVERSTVVRSTLGDPAVSTCIEVVTERWSFPRRRGNKATVVYPFVLQPAEQAQRPRPEDSGRDSGAGSEGRGPGVPRVRQAKASVQGTMDKDVIRRIVRAHINEVRGCYNQGLVANPNLEGRVVVQFTIGPAGKVSAAVVARADDELRRVGNCVAKRVKRWRFPKPKGGGNVVVTYPFVFTPNT